MPSRYRMNVTELDIDINREICAAFQRLAAPPDLLALLGSRYDTLSDFDILTHLREYNAR
jgi:hypothetical protein